MGLGDQSLFDRLEQCRNEGLPGIPDDELLGYIEDSAEAIDFLNRPIHDLGSGPAAIQHCDIKPHNLVLVGGSVQVCDFGLARMMGADRATTAAASVAYAAPECLVEGKPSDTTDQYCLAVTFIELKTGELPYDDLSMASVIDAKRHDKLDFHSLPAALRPVLRRATSSDPAKRYSTCREMVSELRRAMEQSDELGEAALAGRGRSRESFLWPRWSLRLQRRAAYGLGITTCRKRRPSCRLSKRPPSRRGRSPVVAAAQQNR